jgi:hypothetical protein
MTRVTAYVRSELRYPRLLARKILRLFHRRWLLLVGRTWALSREVEFDLHWVDPRRIRYASLLDNDVDLDRGRVVGGDWDAHVECVEETDYFVAYRQVLMEGMDWSDTPFYERVLAEVAAGIPKWGCYIREEFDRRLEYVTSLFVEMREMGYVPNHNTEQICVDVGRHGDLMFVDGQHRLSFAKLLGLPRVPVVLVARHQEWIDFWREIVRYALRHGGRVRDPLLHPDLENIQAKYGPKRFELITRAIRTERGRLLDLGSHWGYFCHRFEELGFECTAVEPDVRNYRFLTRLRRAQHRRFETHNEDPLRYLERMQEAGAAYDVVLAMGLFADPTWSKQGSEGLKHLFSLVNASELYVMPEPPVARSRIETSRHWVFPEENFLDFARTYSRFVDVTCIGHVTNGAPVYRLAQPRL